MPTKITLTQRDQPTITEVAVKHPDIGKKICHCGAPKRRNEEVCNYCRPAYAEAKRQFIAEQVLTPERQYLIAQHDEAKEILGELVRHLAGIGCGRVLFGIIQEFPQIPLNDDRMRLLFNAKCALYDCPPLSRKQFGDVVEEYNFLSETTFGETTEDFLEQAFPIDAVYTQLVLERINDLGFVLHDEHGEAVDAEYILRPLRETAIMMKR